jgi:glucose-6-phosphate isomerase
MNPISLTEKSGLNISLNRLSGELNFCEGILFSKPSLRRVSDAVDFYQNAVRDNPDKILYLMYRGITLEKDYEKINEAKLRYDITVILPGTVGGEYIKTIGHLHPLSPTSNFTHTFTEVYSIIYGKALYILQKFSHSYLLNNQDAKGQLIEDVIITEAEEGDIIFIPSHYGHTTINIGSEPLVMANILHSEFNSLYEPYKKLRGASYYIGERMIKSPFKNQQYCNLPEPRFLEPLMLKPPNLEGKEPLYREFLNKLAELSFLYR